MANNIVESKTIVGLEVGTSKVVAVVGEVFPDGVVNVLGVGSCPSRGINKGGITDLEAVANSIQRAVEAAESIADCQIISVTLAITGDHIQSLNESGFVPISEGEVTQEEIDSAMYTASSVKMPEGVSVLHIIPQEYAVDKQFNIKNPLGLQGVRLKAQAHLVACHQDWLNNLRKAVERCGLKVDQIVFSGLASSYSVLTEDEKELGVCLIDMGGGTMDITVFTNGALRYSRVIPYAGDRVTEDIAAGATTSRMNAEAIKVSFGSAITPPRVDAEKKIEVTGVGGRVPKTITKDVLSQIISPRYSELFSLVKRELDRLKMELMHKQMPAELLAGVVLTGGGAQIEDAAKCAEQVFDMQVRVASPLNLTGLTDYVNKPQYSTVLGLLQYSYHTGDDGPVRSFEDTKVGGVWAFCKKVVNKIKSEF
ncbi:cell division protein FtsA [Cricetibacter osteomyelitidis]|uniref:Cell division protein FtsA n=1 Tax=Cricetibacter osteomyelitidis TaxID=1521931 RepID=A0A4R2TJL7_9PAST|nr:cell division protein FtsA [Cricetibacter osteomyelitidis]TCP95012.1 cell division protein FtsA [Cricetibacter osteomyelitidis]